METIYENNDVKIQIERVDKWEGKLNFNGQNLMWISLSEKEKLIKELQELLDKYRI